MIILLSSDRIFVNLNEGCSSYLRRQAYPPVISISRAPDNSSTAMRTQARKIKHSLDMMKCEGKLGKMLNNLEGKVRHQLCWSKFPLSENGGQKNAVFNCLPSSATREGEWDISRNWGSRLSFHQSVKLGFINRQKTSPKGMASCFGWWAKLSNKKEALKHMRYWQWNEKHWSARN